MTGDLTNHNADSAFYVRQSNQAGECVNIGGLEPSNVQSCLFHAIINIDDHFLCPFR